MVMDVVSTCVHNDRLVAGEQPCTLEEYDGDRAWEDELLVDPSTPAQPGLRERAKQERPSVTGQDNA